MMIDNNNNMGRFFDWLAKPMNQDDINAWYLANNIIPELTDLFMDFCIIVQPMDGAATVNTVFTPDIFLQTISSPKK